MLTEDECNTRIRRWRFVIESLKFEDELWRIYDTLHRKTDSVHSESSSPIKSRVDRIAILRLSEATADTTFMISWNYCLWLEGASSFVLRIHSMIYDRGDYQVEIAAICLVSGYVLDVSFSLCCSFLFPFRFFRVIPAETYLTTFSSDRRHMRRPDGSWIKPPPSYAPIQTMCE